MTWMSYAVPVGDEVYFYYGGYARGHKIEAQTERQIGLARMKKDRYVALVATEKPGVLITKPFLLPGGELTVNANAGRGAVRVSLLGADRKPLNSRAEPELISGDVLAQTVRWPESIETARGQPVRLEFELQNAALFGFQFS